MLFLQSAHPHLGMNLTRNHLNILVTIMSEKKIKTSFSLLLQLFLAVNDESMKKKIAPLSVVHECGLSFSDVLGAA